MRYLYFLLLPLSFLFITCNSSNTNKITARDTTINQKTSYNNLFLDSVTIEGFIVNEDSLKKYRSQFFDFYDQRNFEFAWFDADGMTEQAHYFYNLQNNFAATLNDSSIYNSQLQQLYEWLLNNSGTRNKSTTKFFIDKNLFMQRCRNKLVNKSIMPVEYP